MSGHPSLVRTTPTLAAVLLSAALLAGCSDGAVSEAGTDPTGTPAGSGASTPTETPTQAPTEAPTEDPTEDPTEASSTVSTDLVSFQAPEGWIVVTPEDVLAGDTAVELDDGNDLMDEIGVSGEELRQLLSQAEVVAVDGEGRVDDFLANVNVIQQPGPIGTEDQLVEAYQGLGASDPEVRDEEAGGIDVRVVEYAIPVGDLTVEGRSVTFPIGDEAVSISVSTRDAGDSDAIFQQVLDTLEPAA